MAANGTTAAGQRTPEDLRGPQEDPQGRMTALLLGSTLLLVPSSTSPITEYHFLNETGENVLMHCFQNLRSIE